MRLVVSESESLATLSVTLLDKVSLLPTIRASMKPLSNSPEFAEALKGFEYHGMNEPIFYFQASKVTAGADGNSSGIVGSGK